jgi:hypothetical protein
MDEKTRKKVIEKILLNDISDPCDDRIESIAMDFPDKYNSEDEFVAFQMDIGNIVEEIQK